ncbi:MAG: hypothetical protein AB7I35_12845 [Ramlibacter sp.]
MKSALQKIQLFTPIEAAREIEGVKAPTVPDLTVKVMEIHLTRALDSLIAYVVQGDYSKPWELLDAGNRGTALVSYQFESEARSLYVHRDNDALTMAAKQSIWKFTPATFAHHQIWRAEIRRWLAEYELASAYDFGEPVAESATEPVKATSSPPIGLKTGEIAYVFRDIHFDLERWKTNLEDPPKWASEHKLSIGKPGGDSHHQATWDPLGIAKSLATNGRVIKPKTRRDQALVELERRFQKEDLLEPFRADWMEFFELMKS